jgi:hypothetical protein
MRNVYHMYNNSGVHWGEINRSQSSFKLQARLKIYSGPESLLRYDFDQVIGLPARHKLHTLLPPPRQVDGIDLALQVKALEWTHELPYAPQFLDRRVMHVDAKINQRYGLSSVHQQCS